MSDVAGAETPRDPKPFHTTELFLRELSEVRLLIDFISGRPEKSLGQLASLKDFETLDGQRVTLGPQDIIAEIGKITYPPNGNLETSAWQGALIMMVKDNLNLLAAPAKGLTVAFTSMFAGVAINYKDGGFGYYHLLQRLFSDGRKKPRAGVDAGYPNGGDYSALTAYPNLVDTARRFRQFFAWQVLWAFLSVLVVIFINFDINVTSGMLQQIGSGEADSAKLFSADLKFVPTPRTCHPSSAQPVASGGGAETELSPAETVACGQAEAAYLKQVAGRANLRQHILFDPPGPVSLTMRLLHPTILQEPVPTGGPEDDSPCAQVPSKRIPDKTGKVEGCRSILAPSPLENSTLAVLAALNSTVIPALFGYLGTVAGLVRTLTAKTRESVLAPRDFLAAQGAIPLGMVAGVVVGFFFNTSDPGGALAKTLGSNVTVSAAGLSFLAGFGAETFFIFLNLLLSRLMPANPQGPPIPSS
jgi:hypothetical protein